MDEREPYWKLESYKSYVAHDRRPQGVPAFEDGNKVGVPFGEVFCRCETQIDDGLSYMCENRSKFSASTLLLHIKRSHGLGKSRLGHSSLTKDEIANTGLYWNTFAARWKAAGGAASAPTPAPAVPKPNVHPDTERDIKPSRRELDEHVQLQIAETSDTSMVETSMVDTSLEDIKPSPRLLDQQRIMTDPTSATTKRLLGDAARPAVARSLSPSLGNSATTRKRDYSAPVRQSIGEQLPVPDLGNLASRPRGFSISSRLANQEDPPIPDDPTPDPPNNTRKRSLSVASDSTSDSDSLSDRDAAFHTRKQQDNEEAVKRLRYEQELEKSRAHLRKIQEEKQVLIARKEQEEADKRLSLRQELEREREVLRGIQLEKKRLLALVQIEHLIQREMREVEELRREMEG